MRFPTVLAALALLAAPAVAGEGEGRCLEGFSCDNECPLAQQANAWRAVGTESLSVTSRVQADHAAAVTKNLGKIV